MLVACGVALPLDPLRTPSAAELLLEAQYQHLEHRRFACTSEPEAGGVHMYSLSDEVFAEAALALETSADHHTKMMHARCLQRHDALGAEETLQVAWSSTLPALRARTGPFLAPPEVPLAGNGPGRGRGRPRRG